MKKINVRDICLAKNTISGLAFQIVTVICGFVLPRAILQYYGSDINGLVNSVAQFLQVIAFLELGVGAVVQSSLYKPISNNDISKISEVIAAGNAFFRKIACALIIYVVILILIFPVLVDVRYGFIFDALLILAMSISYFAQYYFGIIDRIFLNAAQHGYISNYIYIITLIINTAMCYWLVCAGFSIQLVKFVTSIIFLTRPIIVRLYVNKYYSINRKAIYTIKSIPQKWNGVAQHIAAIVLDSTDTVVLSLFSTLANVSIYSVYNIVVSGLCQLFLVAFNGVMALFGELWAKNEKVILGNYFKKVEIILHLAVIDIWLCTYKLIVPFVLIYTENVRDADYNVPLFALLICLASTFYCFKMTYNSMILAAGHYKQTQHIFIAAAGINIVVSILFVAKFGLVGVAIGTIIAMMYQTLHMQYYCIIKLQIYSYTSTIKQYFIDIICVAIVLFFTDEMVMTVFTWKLWVLFSLKVTFVITMIVTGINAIFHFKTFKKILM